MSVDPEYIEAKIADNHEFAGKEVKVLAKDYASKSDDDPIEVKIDDDVVLIEKKYIIIEDILSKETPVEEQPAPEKEVSIGEPENTTPEETTVESPNSHEIFQAKLRKALTELEDLKKDMTKTYTSTETISNNITSLKGVLDAMKKDQLELKESMDKTVIFDLKKTLKEYESIFDKQVKSDTEVIKAFKDAPEDLVDKAQKDLEVSGELLVRTRELMSTNNMTDAMELEMTKKYPNSTEQEKNTNHLWFELLKQWNHLLSKMN